MVVKLVPGMRAVVIDDEQDNPAVEAFLKVWREIDGSNIWKSEDQLDGLFKFGVLRVVCGG